MNGNNILVSRRRAAELAGTAPVNVRTLVARGRVVEADALIGDTVRKGVTLASLAGHYGWSQATVDQILSAHGVPVDSDGYHYLTCRDETEPDD